MKNFINISAILCAAALLFGLASCAPEELDTNQFSEDAVTLASFGPNPVIRGAQLRFFGSNLQKIVEVQVPGIDPITEIEVVKSGKVSEIRVALPVEGPEVGFVSLKASDGTILKTMKELTYSESIVFDGFESPNPAYPGDIVTLKGDYMYLVQYVVFEGGATVNVEEGSTRHEAKVIIPATAVTGKIIISDGAEVENLFYSEEELQMGSPSVTRGSLTKTKPGDKITFKGEHLEMIKAVDFPIVGEGTITVEELESGENGITVTVPKEAADGFVYAVSYAGGRYEICQIESVMPSELVATNTPKAGSQLVITGKNFDVVSKVDLAGAAGAAFELKDGKLNVTVPATATQGTALLYHPNGNSVELAYDIVHPAITSVSPLELYAGDEPVIVEGTDLDLVIAAKIGAKDVEISDKTETKLTLATAVTSASGNVVLTLANKETITSEQQVKMNYHSKVIVTSRPASQHIGMEVTLQGSNMDLIESIFIGETKVTKYGLRSAEEIHFLMPQCKAGSYELKFVLYDGDIEIQADPIEVLLEISTKTIWEGEWSCGSWGGNQDLAWGGYDWSTAKPGDILTFEFELSGPDSWHQLDLRTAADGWPALPTSGFMDLSEGQTCASYTLDAATLEAIVSNNGLIITGTSYILHKVTISFEVSQEITVFQGPCSLSWGEGGQFGIAMTHFEKCTAGSKLIFYVNFTDGEWGQCQINDAAWGNIKFAELGDDAYINPNTTTAGDSRVELTLTEDILSHILATAGDFFGVNTDKGDGRSGMIVQGDKMTVKEVTILP